MRKLKIYLDTSVISHLEQPEKPSEYEYTHLFWEEIKQGKFDIFLSKAVFDELGKCSPEKQQALYSYLADIDYTNVEMTEEVINTAEEIIKRNILPPKSVFDSYHISAALVSECDYVLSWNMKHIANVETNKDIRHIVIDKGYRDIQLIPPSMLIKRGDDND